MPFHLWENLREKGMLPTSVLSSQLEGVSISRIKVLGVTGHEFLSPSEPEICLISFIVAICFSKKFSSAHIAFF